MVEINIVFSGFLGLGLAQGLKGLQRLFTMTRRLGQRQAGGEKIWNGRLKFFFLRGLAGPVIAVQGVDPGKPLAKIPNMAFDVVGHLVSPDDEFAIFILLMGSEGMGCVLKGFSLE